MATASGTGRQQLGTAGALTHAAAAYSPERIAAASAGPAALTGAIGYDATDANAAMANMANINQYMNPYTQQVIDASMADLEKARQSAAQKIGQQAQAAKAFGGSRQAVAESLTNQQYAEQAGKTISQLRAQGFDTAANLMQQDLARQQQAALQNAAQRTAAAQFGAGAMNQAALSNQAALNQMAQYNAGNLQAANLANQAAGLQGAQFRLGAANQLGALGQAQTASDLQSAQNFMNLGTARQQFAQQQMDAARNLGLERLGIMQGALGLQPANLGGTTTSPVYQNTGANVLGGALGGASLAGTLGMSAGAGAGLGALLGLI